MLAVLLAWAPGALALDETTRSTIRKMSAEGVAAYQREDYATALEKLNKAWGILQTAPLGLWSGRALEKSGRLVEASERYLAAERAAIDPGGDKAAQEAARAEARDAYEVIQSRIPMLTVELEGAEASSVSLTIDGRAILADLVGVPIAVDPGSVEVVGTQGDAVQKRSVTLAEGEKQTVTLTFEPTTAAKTKTSEGGQPSADEPASTNGGPGWQRIAGWTGVGVGGAGLILGGITGGILLSQWEALGCGQNPMCNATPDQTSGLNDLRTISSIGFIAGGILTAAGVTLLLTAPTKERTASLRPYFTGDSVGLMGAF